MGDRKLLAAFLTSLLTFFLWPIILMEPYNAYFEVGLGVSIVAVPIIFTYGIFSSIWAERIANKREKGIELVKFLLHIVFGIGFTGLLFILIYPFWSIDFFIYGKTLLIGGLFCSMLYYLFDLFIRMIFIKKEF